MLNFTLDAFGGGYASDDWKKLPQRVINTINVLTRKELQNLYFTVREPFPSKTSSASLVFGKVTEKNALKLISQMPEHGVIFSDGIEADFLEFNSGTEATISVAEKKGHLVI